MGGVGMWMRSCWRLVLPLMVLTQIAAMLNVQGDDRTSLPAWSLDWSFMLSLWNGATLLLSPVAAAVTVLLMQRAWRDPVDGMVASLPRALRSRLDIVASVFLLGLAAQLGALVVASGLCIAKGADATGVTLPWQLLTGPCALLAATCLGGLLGELWKDPWAIPVTAVGVFLSQNLFYGEGYPELLATEAAGWFMTGLRPMPSHLAATVLANLCAAAGFLGLALWHVPVRGLRRWEWLAVGLAGWVGVALVFGPFVASHAMDTYEELR